RCACSELNSCSSPPRRICGCRSRQRTVPFRRALLLAGLSLTGLRGERGACLLGQAKEPRARQMRPGNPLGDDSQRAIALALVLEPVLLDEDGVRVSAPLPHQGRRAGLYDTAIYGQSAFAWR